MTKKDFTLKTLFDGPLYTGHDQYESSLFAYNNIQLENIKKLFPDTFMYHPSPDEYYSYMEPIDKGDEFIKFIKSHSTEKMFIVGDYDCDGICATTILSFALSLCGVEVGFAAPDRFEDGYGMKCKHVDEAIRNNATVLLTVDNGITANDAIQYAKEKGLYVCVTDHHTPQGTSPADLVINPWYNNDKFKEISGATVAFKLVYLLYKEYHFDKIYLDNFMMLAGFTVCSDVMPVIEENRILLVAAMNYANDHVYEANSFIHRLAVMLEYYNPNSSSDPYLNLPGTFRDFNKENIDFYFVPIINAANRVLGNVNDLIFDIITLFDREYDGPVHLYSGINKNRKFMRSELFAMHKKTPATVVVEAYTPHSLDANYAGIVGLVASDIVEGEGKPALVGIKTNSNPIIHFSGRSLSGFDLYSALNNIKIAHPDMQFTFGGHAEALGMACCESEMPMIQKYLEEELSTSGKIETAKPVYYDIGQHISEMKTVFRMFYPYGNKFEFPKFYVESKPGLCDFKKRTFTLPDFSKTESIKLFSKADFDRIATIFTKNRQKTVKCIVSLSCDENGNVYCKADKLLLD